MALGAATASQAQQITVDAINAWGCESGQFRFDTIFSGFSPEWNYSARVEQEGQVFMDHGFYAIPLSDGPRVFSLRAANHGEVTAAWPLAAGKPFTVTLTTVNTKTHALGHVTTTTVSSCASGGAIQGNTTMAAPAGARVPSHPSSLKATPGDGQVRLDWTLPADPGGSPLAGYYVVYGPTGSASADLSAPGCAPASASATGCTIAGLSNGTPYSFMVRAANSWGKGTNFNASAIPSASTGPHAIVTNVNPPGSGQLTCTPNPVPHGDGATCTASADPDYFVFSHFSGDCAGSACTLTHVSAPQNVTAHFTPGPRYFSGAVTLPNGQSAQVEAKFTGGGPACAFVPTETGLIPAPALLPNGQKPPLGLFSFKLDSCDDSPVTMRVTWPMPVAGVVKFGKRKATEPAPSYYVPEQAHASGLQTVLTITDGGPGDQDFKKNGQIVDPLGPLSLGSAATAVPTLQQWALAMLGLLAAGLGMRRLRQQ